MYDTGPGIAAHEREIRYVEFTRLEQGSPWGEKGLGLGLSICDRLARLLSHELTLRSQLGKGSVFGVRVPRIAQASRPERHRAVSSAGDPVGLRALRVLVVDNDHTILDAMQALLEQWGVQVLRAHDSAQAMRLMGSESVDAVLADYHLGDGSNDFELFTTRRRGPRRDPCHRLDHRGPCGRANS